MAAWQATFELLPASAFPPDYCAQLERIAPSAPSWAEDLEWWGREDGDRIDVWSEGGRPTEALVRFDLRVPDEGFVRGVVAFAARAGLHFQAENGAAAPAQLAAVALALQGSRAARFVTDPARYFARLRAGGPEEA